MLTLQQSGADVLLPVTVQPRASRNAVAGLHGNALKLLLTAPPVEGAANAACLRLLSRSARRQPGAAIHHQGHEGAPQTHLHHRYVGRHAAHSIEKSVSRH